MVRMNIQEVKKYYGRSYSKIIRKLESLTKDCTFNVDTSCGEYLELEYMSEQRYFKVNHGISNKYPYNTCFRGKGFSEMERKSFRTQDEVVEYMEKLAKRASRGWV